MSSQGIQQPTPHPDSKRARAMWRFCEHPMEWTDREIMQPLPPEEQARLRKERAAQFGPADELEGIFS